MSQPKRAPNTKDMESYLRDTYNEVVRVDDMLHRVRDDMRSRLYALHLMTSGGDQIRERVRIAEEHNEAGKELPDALTPEEFEHRFLASS